MGRQVMFFNRALVAAMLRMRHSQSITGALIVPLTTSPRGSRTKGCTLRAFRSYPAAIQREYFNRAFLSRFPIGRGAPQPEPPGCITLVAARTGF